MLLDELASEGSPAAAAIGPARLGHAADSLGGSTSAALAAAVLSEGESFAR